MTRFWVDGREVERDEFRRFAFARGLLAASDWEELFGAGQAAPEACRISPGGKISVWWPGDSFGCLAPGDGEVV